jgi:hypothetical protein
MGKVVAINQHRAKIRVERVWKGQLKGEVIMLMDKSAFKPKGKPLIKYPFTSCGYVFKRGGKYMVFANQIEGQFYRTGACTGTQFVDKEDDFTEFEQRHPPIFIKQKK